MDEVHYTRSRVKLEIMDDIGYEDCDFVSTERHWQFWNRTFPGGKLHEVPIELHIPCRDPIEHLMSQCNHKNLTLDCNAANEEALYASVNACLLELDRFHINLLHDFNAKCYKFENQFTSYTDYMSHYLQKRRFESTPLVKRETNAPRNKTNECIWGRPDLRNKIAEYLKGRVHYYKFCEECIGSDVEITSKQ